MAENYGSLEGTLDAHDTLEGEMNNHSDLTGEIQFSGGVGGVKDVQVNNESVVDANKVAHIDLTPYAEKEDVYDKQTIDTALEGKADTDDIPTELSDLQDDADHRTVTDAEKTEWSGKSNVSANPSTTTETLTGIEIDGTAYAIPSGGSGDVADVKVNGTSVVDPVTKEAEIDLSGYAETSDIPTDLADLSDDATHRLVTDTEKSTWDNKADVSDIPTVNNPTITIQKNGQNVDTFTLNQTANKVIDISVPTKTSDLQNDNSFITNTVDNLANYYLKSDTYTQTEVNNLISAAVNGRFEKVTTLPASGEPNVIYLVPKTTALTNNVYDEYIWQDNAWELLGSTEIDLSNYVTTTDLSTALADYVTSSTFNTTIANYYTKTEVGNLLDNKVDKVSGKGLSTYDYDATAKGIVDNVTTNLAGKVDKVNGKGLSTEDYTTTEKNKLAGISTNAKKVEASTTNGNIKIDGTETQVYDDSEIQDKIDETTTSISGNPISISGLKSNQLAVNPIITLEPIQAGSGTPSPSNIRAISGYDKIEALSCGVNIWDETWELGGIVWNTGQEIAATDRIRTGFIPAISEGTYYLYVLSSIIGSGYGVVSYNKSKERISSNSGIAANSTFTTPANTAYIRLVYIGITSYTSGISVNYPSTVHDYVPYHKTTDLSESLGQTVYGGSLDVRTGKFVVKYGILDLGDLSWTYSSQHGRFWVNIPDANIKLVSTSTIFNAFCSIFEPVSWDTVTDNTVDNSIGLRDTAAQLNVRCTSYTDATIFKNAMVGQKLVYELATPFTIQLTPHEISLLKDYAYICTNGTTIALDYHNGEMASLSDVNQLAETVEKSRFHRYSTDEQVIGSWIDGKTLYEKTIISQIDSGALSKEISLVSLSINELINVFGHIITSTGNLIIGANDYTSDATQLKVKIYFTKANKNLIEVTRAVATTFGDTPAFIITIQYTKS